MKKKFVSGILLLLMVVLTFSIANASFGTTPYTPAPLTTSSVSNRFHFDSPFTIGSDIYFIDNVTSGQFKFYSVGSDGTENLMTLSGAFTGTSITKSVILGRVETYSGKAIFRVYDSDTSELKIVSFSPSSATAAATSILYTYSDISSGTTDYMGALRVIGSDLYVSYYHTDSVIGWNTYQLDKLDLSANPVTKTSIEVSENLRENPFGNGWLIDITDAQVCGGKLYISSFYGHTFGPNNKKVALWKNNGVGSNSKIMETGTDSGSDYMVSDMFVSGTKLTFMVTQNWDGNEGEIWQVDCTTDTATKIYDLPTQNLKTYSRASNAQWANTRFFIQIGDTYYFSAKSTSGSDGWQLYGIDAAAAGVASHLLKRSDISIQSVDAVALTNINTSWAEGHYPSELFKRNGKLYYRGIASDFSWYLYDLEGNVATPTPTPAPTSPSGGGGNGGNNDESNANNVSSDPGPDGIFGTADDPINANLPLTGFSQSNKTILSAQPKNKAYTNFGDLTLNIPSLSVSLPVVGVPEVDGTWDVSWLNDRAGYLNGSAFPTWEGNSVITGHVWSANNKPGPFVNLRKLGIGDTFQIIGYGQVATYTITESRLVWPEQASIVLQKVKGKSVITLLTCEDYSFLWDSYSFRRMVRAELTSIE